MHARGWLDRSTGALFLATVFLCFFSISAMQVALVLALLAWAVGLRRAPADERRFPLLAPLVAFALASLVSALAADDRERALSSLRETLLPCIVFLAAQRLTRRGETERTLVVLQAGALLAALVGLAQSVRHGAAYRIHGTHGHYMTYAGVLLTGSLVALAGALFASDRRTRALALTTLAATLPALLLTHTRSAWLGWIAGAAVALALWRRAALLALPAIALVTFLVAPGAVRERIASIVDARDTTAVERTYMWRAGARLWRDHFWIGVGPENLRAAYPAYQLPDDPWLPERRFTHLHDNPLQIAGERGVLGLAAWMWIWIAHAVAAVRAWRATVRTDRVARAAIAGSLAALAGFHVSGIFEYTFGNSEVVTLAWIAVALAFVAPARALRAVTEPADGDQPPSSASSAAPSLLRR